MNLERSLGLCLQASSIQQAFVDHAACLLTLTGASCVQCEGSVSTEAHMLKGRSWPPGASGGESQGSVQVALWDGWVQDMLEFHSDEFARISACRLKKFGVAGAIMTHHFRAGKFAEPSPCSQTDVQEFSHVSSCRGLVTVLCCDSASSTL